VWGGKGNLTMKTRKIVSLCIALVYGFFAAASPVLADNEFDGNIGGGSDGAWGWNPPNHDRFGSGDGIGGGSSFNGADDYGSGNGPFGGGGSQLAGRMGLFAFLIALISGRNGMVGEQRDRASFGIMNLMTADSSSSNGGGAGRGGQNRQPDGRITVPGDNFIDQP